MKTELLEIQKQLLAMHDKDDIDAISYSGQTLYLSDALMIAMEAISTALYILDNAEQPAETGRSYEDQHRLRMEDVL